MIFSTLCVAMYSGGLDCSYEWTQVPDPVLMEGYREAGGTKPFIKEQLVGFTDFQNRQVWFGEPVHYNAIQHEIKHVICHLEWEKHGVDHPKCKGHFAMFE